MRVFVIIVFLISIFGCANVDNRKLEAIQYFHSEEEAPPHQVIAVFDALGMLSLVDFKPTFEKAIIETKLEAYRRKGDAIIFLEEVKAADLPVDIDVDIVSVLLRGSGILSGSEKGSKGAFKAANTWDKIEKVDCQKQPAWLFKIVKLKPRSHFSAESDSILLREQ